VRRLSHLLTRGIAAELEKRKVQFAIRLAHARSISVIVGALFANPN
jgi:hypothetical protein